MHDSQGDGTRRAGAQELILRTIAAHADSLLRTARRHSICADDAQDAYQRAIEIFMGRAHRLDSARAAGWLHVVVKREAQALRRERQKLLMSAEVDLDGRQAEQPTPEERALRFEMVNRSAEALKRLKPQELRALWLRAQGHSYSDIAAITGWSYTKVNRCLTEGRHSFLERYEGIESGEECRRWLPVLSAIVDGEATPEQVVDVRPHLRNCPACRATLKALRDSSGPLSAVLPVPLVVAEAAGCGDHVSHLLMRCYEAVAGGLHERAVNSLTRTQALVEATAGGKVAAVAASAAAVAGGGYASVEQVIDRPAKASRADTAQVRSTPRVAARPASLASAAPDPVAQIAAAVRKPATKAPSQRREFRSSRPLRPQQAPEFRSAGAIRAAAASVGITRGSTGGAPPAAPATAATAAAAEARAGVRRRGFGARVRPLTRAARSCPVSSCVTNVTLAGETAE